MITCTNCNSFIKLGSNGFCGYHHKSIDPNDASIAVNCKEFKKSDNFYNYENDNSGPLWDPLDDLHNSGEDDGSDYY